MTSFGRGLSCVVHPVSVSAAGVAGSVTAAMRVSALRVSAFRVGALHERNVVARVSV